MFSVMKLRYLIVILGIVFSFSVKSQITSNAHDYAEATEYSDDELIYIYCTDDVNAGSFIVYDSTGVGSKDHEWYKFNETLKDFSDPLSGFTINNDSTSSSILGLATGGYKAIVKGGSEDQEYIAWIYNTTDRSVELTLDPSNDCSYIAVNAQPNYQTGNSFETQLSYYNISTGTPYVLHNSIETYSWSSDTEPQVNSYSRPVLIVSGELPVENTIFDVGVTDRFGCIEEDNIDYTAVATKALFSWVSYDHYSEEETGRGDNTGTLSQEAPLDVIFTNESKNGENYLWWFGDTTKKNDLDTVITNDFLLEPLHTYYYTSREASGKDYTMKLVSESFAGCKDSIEFTINIKPFEIEFPNVFTPNGDLENDVYNLDSLKHQSIKNFRITIFNRVGQVVHKYDGEFYNWEGWDGKIKNSNREAAEGTYYIVVEIDGWDKKTYTNKFYTSDNNSSSDESTTDGETSPTTTSTKIEKFGVIRLYR